MHLLQSKSLREPDFLFGFKGRELQLFATSFHPLAPVGRWQPVAALPEAGLGVMVGHRASAWAPPLPTRSRKGQGAPGPPPRAAFCPITPISEAFVRKLRGAFWEPPSGAHSTRRGENNPYRFPPRGRKAARCWTLKSSQEAFSGVMASGVTWGWRVHELSTTLVQIPDLNIGPGSCQLSSVTWSPRGSSYGRHPSRCSLACAQQLLLRVLLLGSPSPAPSWRLVTLSQHLPAASVEAESWSRSRLAWWLVPSGTRLAQPIHCGAVFRLLQPQPVPLPGRRQKHSPLIHITLDQQSPIHISTPRNLLWNLLWKAQIFHESPQWKLDAHC